MRYCSRIIRWNDEKGFGFIAPPGGETGKTPPHRGDVFVHIKEFSNRRRRPETGDVVTYELATDARQRTRAVNVQYLRDAAEAAEAAQIQGEAISLSRTLAYCGAGGFLLCLLVIAAMGRIPVGWVVLYVGMSVAAFAFYAHDKAAGQNGAWRVPENILHLLALLGGWPGALCAQQALRHKTRKPEFLIVFWCTVAANIAALVYLLTQQNGNG